MCRINTPPQNYEYCDRCGRVANPNDGWEHDWPLYGRLQVGYPAQALYNLAGTNYHAPPSWDHPALRRDETDHQQVVFEWGNGYKYNSKGRYRLCLACQGELLGVLGSFFNYGKGSRMQSTGKLL